MCRRGWGGFTIGGFGIRSLVFVIKFPIGGTSREREGLFKTNRNHIVVLSNIIAYRLVNISNQIRSHKSWVLQSVYLLLKLV